MSDDLQAQVPGTGGQPEQSLPPEQSSQAGTGSETGTGNETPQYVTKQDFEKALEGVKRAAQSLVDKGQARVNERMQIFETSLKQMQELGQEFTPEQVREMRAAAFDKAIQDVSKPNSPGEPADAQPASWEDAARHDPITANAFQIQKEAGVFLEPNDPETGTVKVDGTPKQYLDSIERAIQAKKERMASAGKSGTTNQETPRDPAARIPSGSGSSATTMASSASEYWAAAYQKK